MNSELVRKIQLKNNLYMEIFDGSRSVAGDRWQVVFEARIGIPLTQEYFSDQCLSDIPLKEALSMLGDITTYSYRKERNFISGDEKTGIMMDMETDFLNTNLDYISSGEFPARVIRRNYRKALSQINLREKQEHSL